MSQLERLLPRLLPVPALLALGLVLLTSERAWTLRTISRTGQQGTSYGGLAIFLAALLTAGYYAAPILMPLFTSWRMRTPSETELGCASALLRGILAMTLYVVAWQMVSRFGFR